MKRIPMDTTTWTYWCATAPAPVLDWDTKAPRVDENGVQCYSVNVTAVGDGTAEVITVKVYGEPKGLTPGAPVRITGLVAIPWETEDGKKGFAHWAKSIESAAARPERAAS